jgi:hypothetical protein
MKSRLEEITAGLEAATDWPEGVGISEDKFTRGGMSNLGRLELNAPADMRFLLDLVSEMRLGFEQIRREVNDVLTPNNLIALGVDEIAQQCLAKLDEPKTLSEGGS